MASCLQVVKADQTDLWVGVLNEIGKYSFYHLPWFHRMAELNSEGRAEMPVVRDGQYVLACPMLIRPLDTLGHGGTKTIYSDATSVRAFAGPLSSNPPPPENVRHSLLRALRGYLADNRIICVYNRLHPLTCDYSVLNGYGTLVEVGVTLSMDLTLAPATQWANYRKDHKKVTRRLQRQGFVCMEAGAEYLDQVVSVYHQTMRRVGADDAFFHGRHYFERLLSENPSCVRLFICKENDSLAGFHICGTCGGIIESHLSGTADEYVQCCPSRLLYEAIRLWGNEIGAQAIHLGGGVGAQRDRLYEFKAGFASQEHTYNTWRYIADQEAYDEACRKASSRPQDQLCSSYFPAYRKPNTAPQPDQPQMTPC